MEKVISRTKPNANPPPPPPLVLPLFLSRNATPTHPRSDRTIKRLMERRQVPQRSHGAPVPWRMRVGADPHHGRLGTDESLPRPAEGDEEELLGGVVLEARQADGRVIAGQRGLPG